MPGEQAAPCFRKRDYPSLETAQQAAEQKMADGATIRLHGYFCELCQHFHVGRVPGAELVRDLEAGLAIKLRPQPDRRYRKRKSRRQR